MDMDLNTLKNGLYFVNFYAVYAKITKKLQRLVLPDVICLMSSQNSKGAFCLWVKALRNDSSTELI